MTPFMDLIYNEKLVGFDAIKFKENLITLHADVNKQLISFKQFNLMRKVFL